MAIKGRIRQEIFYNEENGYGVYIFEVLEADKPVAEPDITIVGHFLRPTQGEVYLCQGEWTEHPRFGKQFWVHELKRESPRTRQAIIKYLSSDLFYGVGKKTAEKIVDQLGNDALQKIAANPDILNNLEGVSAKQAKTIAEGMKEHHALEQAMIFLYQFGLGVTLALKIVQKYKQETVALIKENPYLLMEEIEGIGFYKADEMAKQLGFAHNAPERLTAAFLYILREAANEGHVYLEKGELSRRVAQLLEDVSQEDLEATYAKLLAEKKIMIEEERCYSVSLFYAEYYLSLKIKKLLRQEVKRTFSMSELYQTIGQLEEEFGVTYGEKQREAMIQALASPLMILTGGPGTGKTTVIRGICHLFSRLHEVSIRPEDYRGTDQPFPIRLVAPTGRAAKRLSETTGLPAMTIHRLLGYRGGFFEYDADHPIEGQLLVVDETSMLDIWLAYQLFRAIPDGMQVVLVGDQDQLPSVGPGQVLDHLLQVSEIPRVELDEIFRQAEHSSIITLAHSIKKGEIPHDLLYPMPDRRFFACSKEQVLSVILQTFENAIQKGYTLFDVQILAPMYKGNVGVDRINQEIQRRINPKEKAKKEIVFGDQVFRLGDKVLQLVNHPEYHVYNGDLGVVIAIDEEASGDDPVLWARYDQLEVPYKRTQLNQLALAYACSIHKAQGSEFPIVIMPVLFAYRRMLKRNLLYTGITRSKSYLILCGEPEALAYGVKEAGLEQRNSYLKYLITDDE